MNNENEDIIEIPSVTQVTKTSNQAEHNSTLSFYGKINDPLIAIREMGEMIAGSGMFGCTKAEQGMVLAMQCLAEGKAPLRVNSQCVLTQCLDDSLQQAEKYNGFVVTTKLSMHFGLTANRKTFQLNAPLRI
jgi:hypothetical protein